LGLALLPDPMEQSPLASNCKNQVLSGCRFPQSKIIADEVALVRIANLIVRTCTGDDTSCTDHLGLVSSYGLVGYTDNANFAGSFLAKKVNGSFTIVTKGGGWFNKADLQKYAPDLSATDVSKLLQQATPVWVGPRIKHH